ncbi:MAG: 3',5'-cyclic-nucleotide phosphodiesterase, partial [Aquabacterium sp.]
VFNGTIWPDVTRLPSIDEPVLRFQPFAVGQVLSVAGGRQIEVLPAQHTVPAVGFAVLGRRGAWVFSGDTGPNAALWQRLRDLPVATVVVETAFRNDEQELARISRHLCPDDLGRELAQLQASADVYITHAKPGELDVVMAEIAGLGLPHRIHALAHGQVIPID